MSFFIAKLEKEHESSEVILPFMMDCTERKDQAMIELKVKLFMKKKHIYWLNVVEPKFPPIYYLSLIFAILWLLFGGWGWAIPTAFFALTYLSFWKGFHVYAFKKGLRKKGYKGNIIVMSNERGIEEAVFN